MKNLQLELLVDLEFVTETNFGCCNKVDTIIQCAGDSSRLLWKWKWHELDTKDYDPIVSCKA